MNQIKQSPPEKDLPERGQYLNTRQIKHVFVLGGIHGNERTGVHTVQSIQENAQLFAFGSVEKITAFHGNLEAIRRNARFVDFDLNRMFRYDYHHPADMKDGTYESKRAVEIRKSLGAQFYPTDFIIDLHTTAANMGNCLIVSDDDPWTDCLCARLLQKIPDSTILYDPATRDNDPTSSALALNSITVEMGPIQQGVTDISKIKTAIEIVHTIIKEIDALNGVPLNQIRTQPSALKYIRLPFKIDYPRIGDYNSAVIHHDLWGSDFKPLTSGQGIFERADGTTWRLGEGHAELAALEEALVQHPHMVPVFIGEPAYIEKGVAFLPAVPSQPVA